MFIVKLLPQSSVITLKYSLQLSDNKLLPMCRVTQVKVGPPFLFYFFFVCNGALSVHNFAIYM